ncbi:hypothetical protein B0A55_07911 [Friedmanniomyces simplex]|uniref:Uncharacterized protein n=1 Tax=Friedmanniomyces simplex TaxID=329884 RepID=A0A4U0XBR9_9PEZI|nr:hypothetical protein B0A55_07911 [Friedmanniomyces simplex]
MDYGRGMDYKGKGRASGGEFGVIGQERAAKKLSGVDESPGGVSLLVNDVKIVTNNGLTSQVTSPSPVRNTKAAYVTDDDDNSASPTITPANFKDDPSMKTLEFIRSPSGAQPAGPPAGSGRAKHYRGDSKGTAVTVDTMTEHRGFYNKRSISPRRAMAETQAARQADGVLNGNATSGNKSLTPGVSNTSPAGSKQITAITSPAAASPPKIAPSSTPSGTVPSNPVSMSSLATFGQVGSVISRNSDDSAIAIRRFEQKLQEQSELIARLQQVQENQAQTITLLTETDEAEARSIEAHNTRLTLVINRMSQLTGHSIDPATPQQGYGPYNQPFTYPGFAGYRPGHNHGPQFFGGMQRSLPNVHHSMQPNMQRNVQPNMQYIMQPNMQQHMMQSNTQPLMLANFQNLPADTPLPTPNDTPSMGDINTPNPNDDVFAPTRLMPVMYEQKGYRELLHSTFVKAEYVARTFVNLPIAGAGKERAEGIQHLIKRCAEHLDSTAQAKLMLETPELRVAIITGLFGTLIVEEILVNPILNYFPHDSLAKQYLEAWNQEVKASCIFADAKNFPLRHALAEERARLARVICALPGFQQWVKEQADALTCDFIDHVLPLINTGNHMNAEIALHRSVLEALKIGARMRQEAKVTECLSYRYGCRWDYRDMVQRNSEMMGRPCDEYPPKWVVRATMAPRVSQKSFANGRVNPELLHKGEVILCDRKTNLR